jgi:hypothetical protein
MLQILILVAVTAVLVFSVYSIIRVIAKKRETPVNETMYDVPYKALLDEPFAIPVAVQAHAKRSHVPESLPASIREEAAESAPLPSVAGQTDEELRQPEPLQERVSQQMEEAPNATDPYDKKDNSSLFGSNLRHPEAMMSNAATERFATLDTDVASGVASKISRPTSNDEQGFSAEMAQNGGQFMNGIFAFDSTDTGTQFSAF